MSYSKPKVWFQVASALSFGTATASSATGHNLTITDYVMPFFSQKSVVNFKFKVTTIPDSGSTAVVAHLLNDTNTFGTVVLTTATANQWLTGVITNEKNARFAAAGDLAFKITGTATASGDACGAYDIVLELE